MREGKKMYEILATYMEHSGGTKFYETVQITEEDGASVLVKRHGPITAKIGGGTFTFVGGTRQSCLTEAQKIIREKRRTRSGGTYNPVPYPGGSFNLPNMDGQHVNESALINLVTGHYPEKQAKDILQRFGLTESDNPVVEEDLYEYEKNKEIKRDDPSWGAW